MTYSCTKKDQSQKGDRMHKWPNTRVTQLRSGKQAWQTSGPLWGMDAMKRHNLQWQSTNLQRCSRCQQSGSFAVVQRIYFKKGGYYVISNVSITQVLQSGGCILLCYTLLFHIWVQLCTLNSLAFSLLRQESNVPICRSWGSCVVTSRAVFCLKAYSK